MIDSVLFDPYEFLVEFESKKDKISDDIVVFSSEDDFHENSNTKNYIEYDLF